MSEPLLRYGPPWSLELQHHYDELAAHLGGTPIDHQWRSTPAAVSLHERILRILRGEEPDPRAP
jgi:hypothetical protein